MPSNNAIRLTRHEAAFVLGLSYRRLSDRLKRMGQGKYDHGLLEGKILQDLEISEKRISDAYRRAANMNAVSVMAGCKTCVKLGRACKEHKGLLTFVPKAV